MKRLLASVAALSLAVSSLAACGKVIDENKVQDFIKTTFKEKTKVDLKTIECPKEVKVKAGESFECNATDADNDKLVFAVKMTDDNGSVEFSLKSLNGKDPKEAASAAAASASAQ